MEGVEYDEDNELLFKMIIVGDSGVGKSSILLNFTKDEFRPDYTVTLGVEFNSKSIKIDDETTVKL